MSARTDAAAPGPGSAFTLARGLRLQQRYVLHQPIGLGGMSEVWRADDDVLRRPVAVKALAPDLATDPVLRAGVRREARAVAALNHPHVARVYDYGETVVDDTVVAYLVMELVEGGSLAGRLARGPLLWPEAARVAGQVAAALAAAHRAGLVHRDVKPANVMLTPAGAKVLDFGIAAAARAAPTPAGGPAPVGTPAYAAPEWLDGAGPHPAADVYGVGALFYESLTGQPAVRARTWDEAADMHRHAAPLLPPDVTGLPARLAELCLACLAPDPRDRPTAETVAVALGASRPPVTRRVRTTVRRLRSGGRGRQTRRVRRTGLVLVAGAAAGTLGLVLAAAALISDGPGPVVVAPPAAAASAPAPLGPSAAGSPSPGTAALAASPLTSPGGDEPTAAPAVITDPATVVAQFDQRLTAATAAGRVRADVAVDLRNALADLRNRISQGRPGDLRQRAVDLRRKLSERLAERAIDARTAAQLTALLDPLLR